MLLGENTIGDSCDIHMNAEIDSSKIGQYCVVRDGTKVLQSELGEMVQLESYNNILFSKIGKYCYTGHTTSIINAELGKFNSISWNVSIGGNTHDLERELLLQKTLNHIVLLRVFQQK